MSGAIADDPRDPIRTDLWDALLNQKLTRKYFRNKISVGKMTDEQSSDI